MHEVSIFAQAARYGLSTPPHHHAICTSYAAITPLAADQRTVALLRADARTSGYQLTNPVDVHMHGVCLACQASP